MMAAGMESAAAIGQVIGQKGSTPPPLPWYCPPHPLANAGAEAVADKRVATTSVTTIFLISPPFIVAKTAIRADIIVEVTFLI
jgi:hypothetical protein